MAKAIKTLSIFLSGLFLSYCLIYLYACPSAQLATAIAAEIFALAFSIWLINAKIFDVPTKILNLIPANIKEKLESIRSQIDRGKLALLTVIALFAVIDFTALFFAVHKQFTTSAYIYRAVPSSYWLGFHPAFTLEMLAGAFVQNAQLSQAEPLYKEIMKIRTELCGENSDLASAIYADLGDLYIRMHNLPEAEKWYRRTVAIGARTGRGYTALATLLRETHRYDESNQYYLKALALRQKAYGEDSKQYQDTLRGYKKLQQLLAHGRERGNHTGENNDGGSEFAQ